MSENSQQVIIIGAGVAGLVAALELERYSYKPLILEAADRVGGRVITDQVEGFQLDYGFQVLLTAYPECKQYLDYEALKLRYFDPGAIIFEDGKRMIFNDPLRKPAGALQLLFSSLGTLSDKLKLGKLNLELRKMTIEEIFQQPDMTTMEYLKKYGFSEKVLSNFLKPFFSGIFLEDQLSTSSRMFQFIFKMFSEGYAAIPAEGMQAIPEQLFKKLRNTEIRFNSKVKSVEPGKVILENEETLTAESIIIATNPEEMMPNMKGQFSGFKSTVNLYFSVPTDPIKKNMLGLVPEEKYLINNFCFVNDAAPEYAPKGQNLLSVTLVGIPEMDDRQLEELVKKELIQLVDPSMREAKLLKIYRIKQALPKVDDPQQFVNYTSSRIYENIFLAGDYLLNGSLNAAMTSGRNAAMAVAKN
jgi:phytoene dehydrogenase-like protein